MNDATVSPPAAPVEAAPPPPRGFWRGVLACLAHVPKVVWRTLLGVYFLCAILFLAVRYVVLPQVAHQREGIEAMLSRQIGLAVKITAVQAQWNGLRPQLELQSLRIFDHQGRQALELPRVDAALAWSSVLHLRPILYRLEIHRPRLAVRREADGAVFVAGLRVNGGPAGDNSLGDLLLHQEQILIHDASVSWTDTLRHAPTLALDKLSLRLDNKDDRHHFAVLASPPAQWSERIDLRGDLRGTQLDKLAGWRGSVYLAVERADLAAWKPWIDYPVTLDHGRASVRAWLTADGPRVLGLTADVAVAGLAGQLADELPAFQLRSLSGRLQASWRDGDLTVSGERLGMVMGEGGKIEPTSFSLRSKVARGKNPARVELTTGRLDLGLVAQIATHLPLDASVRARLQQLRPRGKLENLALAWQAGADAPLRFKLDGRVSQLGLDADGAIPGVQGLSGSVTGDERSGEFHLAVRNGALAMPTTLPATVALERASIDGGWGYEPVPGVTPREALTLKLTAAHLENADISGDFSGYWQRGESGPGYLDLHGKANRAKVSSVLRYMPLSTPEPVTGWLAQGLRGGRLDNIGLQVTGNLADFPFQRGNGVFRVEGQMVDADINFAPEWLGLTHIRGSVLFEGPRMLIVGQSGRYREVQAKDVRVEIPDLEAVGQQVLLVDAKASGPTIDFLHYVSDSRLGHKAGSFTRGVQAKGNGELNLHVEVPLHNSRESRVKGDYSFSNNQLKLIAQLPEFTEAAGKLTFTEDGVGLPWADAQFAGRPVHASGVTEDNGDLRIDAQGNVTVDGLRQIARIPVWDLLKGETHARTTIRVHGASTEVNVSTAMDGIELAYPAPLTKAAELLWPMRFSWKGEPGEGGTSTENWRVDIDHRLTVAWEERCQTTQCTLARGVVAAGTTAALPERGWRVAGRFDQIDLDPWRPVIDHLLAGFQGNGSEHAEAMTGVALQSDELVLFGHRFHKVEARAVRQGGSWTMHLDGPDAAGNLVWVEAGRGRLVARLTRLSLDEAKSAGEAGEQGDTASAAGKSEELPALDVEAEQFHLRGLDLGKLQLSAVNADKVWDLTKVALSSPDHLLQGRGTWRNAGPRAGTHLEFDLTSSNAGALLTRLGHANTVRDGKAELVGALDWVGPPSAINYPSLTGQMKLTASAGRFAKLEPGAGRLLGILSLQALPKRLTLDFRDVFSEGFVFDSIQGSMTLKAGVLHTDDLEIQGAAAAVTMKGTTDLGREVHDLRVTVQPTLTETVAVGVAVGQAAVGIVNPMVGVATYLAQKLLRDPVEKIFSYEYEITGPWSDPKIERASSLIPGLPGETKSFKPDHTPKARGLP